MDLPATKKEGYMYITQDTADSYVDISDTERVQLNANLANALRIPGTTGLLNIGGDTQAVYFKDGVPTLALSHVTLETDQYVDGYKNFGSPIQINSYMHGVGKLAHSGDLDEILIKTKIPFQSGGAMPFIDIKGYLYGDNTPFEIQLVFYMYDNKFWNPRAISLGGWKPQISLATYTENNTEYVAINMSFPKAYFLGFTIGYGNIRGTMYDGKWTVTSAYVNGGTSILLTNKKANVPYVAIKSDIISNDINVENLVVKNSISMGREAGTTIGTRSTALGENTRATAANTFATGKMAKATAESAHASGISTLASASGSSAAGNATTASGVNSHAEGNSTLASGQSAHAEGEFTQAQGKGAHAEGDQTKANKQGSHAEGIQTVSDGIGTHTEGYATRATGSYAHAEGSGAVAVGAMSHAEGSNTNASGDGSHAEGYETEASEEAAHAEGDSSVAEGYASHAEGIETFASGEGSHAEGESSVAEGYASHAEGYETQATGDYSHAQGYQTVVSGESAHAEGKTTTAIGVASHVEGLNAKSQGNYSHAEGNASVAIGVAAHAEGILSEAQGDGSHAEGSSVASGKYAHSEGSATKASGIYSHAEGRETIADNDSAHAEGMKSTALGYGSHAEGIYSDALLTAAHAEGAYTQARGVSSHAEGELTKADGVNSHAQGYSTIASGAHSHAEGHSTVASALGAHAQGLQTQATNEYSHAQGNQSIASGKYSSAEGSKTLAAGESSHAEGKQTTANGEASHAEGSNNTVTGLGAHVEGYNNQVSGQGAHAEGNNNIAASYGAHAEGDNNTIGANAWNGHAEGGYVEVQGVNGHAEGYATKSLGQYSHAQGDHAQATGAISHAEGNTTIASGKASHAQGTTTTASGESAHAEGVSSVSSGTGSHAEGGETLASKTYTHAEGYKSQATENYAHAEGNQTNATGEASHAEGSFTVARGTNSHAEGDQSTASGVNAHAEGGSTSAIGVGSHAEGNGSNANSNSSHAEGNSTSATGEAAHSEGYLTTANGTAAHAEGYKTQATNNYAHAQNLATIANGEAQTTIGKYNVTDTTSAFIIGNGTESARSNAYKIDWSGNSHQYGRAYIFRSETSGQDSSMRVVSNSNADGSTWRGRASFGAKNLTLIMGTYNGMAALGAHGWTDAQAESGAAWADLYLNPDGAKSVYIGGAGWKAGTGHLIIKNSDGTTNSKNLLPQEDYTYSLGNPYYNWNEIHTKQLILGHRETASTPSSPITVTRLIFTPPFHTGGPWKINIKDDSGSSYYQLVYGSRVAQQVRHDGYTEMYGDVYIQGNGVVPNAPTAAGFYLGKSAGDENRRLEICSGGQYSYIDFNKAQSPSDYVVRLLADVTTGHLGITANAGITASGTITSNSLYSNAHNTHSIGSSANRWLKAWMSGLDVEGQVKINAKGSGTPLVIEGGASSWTESIRINSASNGWTTIVMGSPTSQASGTGDGIWSLHTYQGNFYLSHNGSDNGSPSFKGIKGDGFYITTGRLRVKDGLHGIDNTAAHALLHTGSERADDASGSTWIFIDDRGGYTNCWGIFADQPNNYIDFYGAGNLRFRIDLNNGSITAGGNAFITGYAQANTVYANPSASGTANGVSLYEKTTPEAYGIAMRTSSNLGTHGAASGDWHTFFTMSGGGNRGWIFRNPALGNTASINSYGTFTTNAAVGSANACHYAIVGGGQYACQTSTLTGYLKITLPVSWTNTMLSFRVNIYNYNTHTSAEYRVGGYNYQPSAAWYNTFAYAVGRGDQALSNLPVRFGHDGSKCAVYIGESNTAWSYPQVIISDVQIGYSGISHDYWEKNWGIAFTTALGTVSGTTVTSTNIGALYLPLTGGTLSGHLYANSGLSWTHAYWAPAGNIYCQPTANSQEWSIDVGSASYTGSYFHVWSARNSASMLRCYADNNAVDVPNGPFTVSGGNAYFTKTIVCSAQIGNYGEGIRLNCNDGQWATIAMGSTGDTGTRANCWSIHRKSDNNFCISRNSSDGVNGLVMTSVGMGLGTAAPQSRLHVVGTTMSHGLLVCNRGSSTAASNYGDAAIEIREYNFGGAQSDTWGIAPRLSFHWGGRVTAQIGLASNGWLYAANASNTGTTMSKIVLENGGTWGINITGSAGSANSATYLSNNTTMSYGWNGLQYFNASMSAASTAGQNNSPTADWYHIIRMNHANGNGYYFDIASCFHNNNMYFKRVASGSSSGWLHIWVQGNSVTSAVWNDYAECREADTTEAGYVLTETGKDNLVKTTQRLQHFAGVSSDTWGFSQGETEKAKTPIAVAGRVLVYTYQDRNNYKPGDCVCAAPGGTVDIMTREEAIHWPDRIVGTVSSVPEYDTWGGGEGADRDPVKVNGRIWIKVR